MIRKIAVSAVALTAALLMLGTPAKADNTTNYPISGIYGDSCSGDLFAYTGTEHNVFNTTVNGTTVHLVEHSNIHITGTGSPSGASYVANDLINQSENFNLTSPQQEFDITSVLTAIGQGGAPNLQLLITQHLTVNADGTVSVNRTDISSTCH